MKRLVVLLLLGMAGAALAEPDPAFCASVCASERKTCRADAQARTDREGLLPADAPEKNPFARTAQVQMRSDDGGALERAGYQHRRMAGTQACEDGYRRCTRGCAEPSPARGGGKAG